MLEDQIDRLSAFNAHGVEYVVVGGHAVDIYTRPRSTKDDEVWQDTVSGEIDGVPVRFISRDHLIKNKLAAGRPRDLGDVDELRKFAVDPG